MKVETTAKQTATTSKPKAEDKAKDKPKKESYNIDEMFTTVQDNGGNKNLSFLVWGDAEVGKTVFSLGCPGPIRYINLDAGLQPNIRFKSKDTKLQEFKCIDYEDDRSNLTDIDNYDCFKVMPKGSLRNFDRAIISLLENCHGGTVVIDTMSTINDWLKALMASVIPKSKTKDGVEYVNMFDWKYVNSKWSWILEKLKSIDATLVILSRATQVYDGSDPVPGQFEPDMRKGWQYQTSVIIEMTKKEVQDPTTNKWTTVRTGKFNKFRGADFDSKEEYVINDISYDKVLDVLKKENVA